MNTGIQQPELTSEEKKYLETQTDAVMTPEQTRECTCTVGGPKKRDHENCPIHYKKD